MLHRPRPLLVLLLGASALAAAALTRAEPEPMAVAASELLAALDAEQRAACAHDLDDAERRNWQAAPMGDAGVRIDAMTDEQRAKARALIASALSEAGVATVDGVIVLEGILVAMEAERGRPSRLHGPGRYFFTVYGDPRGADPWGWRVEGHHLSMTFTCKSGAWIAHGPLFVGSQPARVKGGEHDGMRLLGTQDDAVRSLVASLDDEQRARAVVGGTLPGNALLLPGEDEGFAEPRGLAAADLTVEQRARLRALLAEWSGWLRPDLGAAEARRMEAGLDRTRLVWMGALGVDEPHYWRIVGPHFALEYAAPERDPDHVHALWRDTEHDFGGELLRRHLEEEHSGGGR